MHLVYIIQSLKDHSWYYGYSTDIKRRLEYHNQGKSSYTSKKSPWVLIFQRPFEDKSEALKFERYLKKTRNKTYIFQAFSEFFIRDVAQLG